MSDITTPPSTKHSSMNEKDIFNAFPNKKPRLASSSSVNTRHDALPMRAARKRFKNMRQGSVNYLEKTPHNDGTLYAGYSFTFTASIHPTSSMPSKSHNDQYTSQLPEAPEEQSGLQPSNSAQLPSVTQTSNGSAIFDMESCSEVGRQDTVMEDFDTTGAQVAPLKQKINSAVILAGGSPGETRRLSYEANAMVVSSRASLTQVLLPSTPSNALAPVDSEIVPPSTLINTGNIQPAVPPSIGDVSSSVAASDIQSLSAEEVLISDIGETRDNISAIPRPSTEVPFMALSSNNLDSVVPSAPPTPHVSGFVPPHAQPHNDQLDRGNPLQNTLSAGIPYNYPSPLAFSSVMYATASSTRGASNSTSQSTIPKIAGTDMDSAISAKLGASNELVASMSDNPPVGGSLLELVPPPTHSSSNEFGETSAVNVNQTGSGVLNTEVPSQMQKKRTSLPSFEKDLSSSYAGNGSHCDSDYDSWRKNRVDASSGKKRAKDLTFPPVSAIPCRSFRLVSL